MLRPACGSFPVAPSLSARTLQVLAVFDHGPGLFLLGTLLSLSRGVLVRIVIVALCSSLGGFDHNFARKKGYAWQRDLDRHAEVDGRAAVGACAAVAFRLFLWVIFEAPSSVVQVELLWVQVVRVANLLVKLQLVALVLFHEPRDDVKFHRISTTVDGFYLHAPELVGVVSSDVEDFSHLVVFVGIQPCEPAPVEIAFVV
mmetsp:Transcript_27596/g.59964  ORF Transcript_27596/g.59964 Transcript_27596/m.59964 type:complete len:200 (+) Transcript_27596:136-735(+)